MLGLAAEAAAELAELHRARRSTRLAHRRPAAVGRARRSGRRPAHAGPRRGAGRRAAHAAEREVALLAAGGRSSRDIGERLGLSTRTVDTHLARVYRKLGITGRAELASALGVPGTAWRAADGSTFDAGPGLSAAPCDDPSVAGPQQYSTNLGSGSRDRVFVPVPFDPDRVWGRKAEHHVHGTVNGMGVRGVIEAFGESRGIVLGPAWRRGCGLATGDAVDVVLEPEGPQRGDLAPDVAAALAADPRAGEFFDAIAQFYRRAYLRYIDSTKRRPELRAARIAEVVELLAAGIKQRPGT